MPFNGSGLFTRAFNWVNDAANGINITASRVDSDSNDFASGLSNCVTRDGQGKPTGAIDWNGQNLTNIANLANTGNTTLGDAVTDTLNVGANGLVKDASGNVCIGTTTALVTAASRGNVTINGATSSILVLGVGAATAGHLFSDGINVSLTSVTAGSLLFSTNSVNKLGITSDGRIFGAAIHNNAGAMTGPINQYIGSGTYTPTLTAVTNIAASTSAVCRWMRVGNVVNVCGLIQVDPTTTATFTELGISLPIASTFATGQEAAGVACRGPTAAPLVGAILINLASPARVSLGFTCDADASNKAWNFTFQYEVL